MTTSTIGPVRFMLPYSHYQGWHEPAQQSRAGSLIKRVRLQRPPASQRPRHYVLVTALLYVAGCTGTATIHVIPADYDRISTSRDLISVHHPTQACFWVDARGDLCLALSSHPALHPDAQPAPSFDLSLVLEGQPAGLARNYLADRRTMRAIIQDKIGRYRYGSLEGIVAIWFEEDNPDLLIGRLRILANEQDHTWWRGWAGNRRVLLVGEFQAIRDTINGQALLNRTDTGAMKRPPPIGKPIPVTGPPLANLPDVGADKD